MTDKGYIDTGDRVVIISDGTITGFGGADLSKHKGKHGLVLGNDGWGCCTVKLDDGETVTAWNSSDLKREETDD